MSWSSFGIGLAGAVGSVYGGPIGGALAQGAATSYYESRPSTSKSGAMRPRSRSQGNPSFGKSFGAQLGNMAPLLAKTYIDARAAKAANAAAAPRSLDLAKLRDEAIANGFNPLTVLGNTGGQGFMTQSQGPKLSTGDFIASAMARGSESYFNTTDQQTKSEIDGLRRDMMREELFDLKRRNQMPLGGFGYSIPKSVTQSQESQPVPLGASVVPEAGRSTVTNPYSTHGQHFVNPRRPDASATEERYGDAQQELTGQINLISDAFYNRKVQKIVKTHGIDIANEFQAAYAKHYTKSFDEVLRMVVLPKLSRPKSRPRRSPAMPSSLGLPMPKMTP